MSNPFISDNRFEVTIKYVEKETKGGLSATMVVSDKETEERYKGSINEIHTQWVQPNWKESNELSRQCTRWDPIAGERLFDWNSYRIALVERYMKSWDISLKNDKGEDVPVPCTKENIDKLDPNIASALIDAFLNKTTPSEEKLGN